MPLTGLLAAPLLLAAMMSIAAADDPAAGVPGKPSFRDTRRLLLAPVTPTSETTASSTAAAPPPALPASATAAASPPNAARPDWLTSLASGACGLPAITTRALSAGHMELVIHSPCRAGEAVEWRYGSALRNVQLDAAGKATVDIDCFAASSTPVAVAFKDGSKGELAVVTAGLEQVSKVAVLWQGPARLGLEAFERGAVSGGQGHVRVVPTHATADDYASAEATQVAVYTYAHRADEPRGLVTFAVVRQLPATSYGGACDPAAMAEVPVRLVVLSPGAMPVSSRAIVAAGDCGATLVDAARLETALLPALRLGAQ